MAEKERKKRPKKYQKKLSLNGVFENFEEAIRFFAKTPKPKKSK